MVMIHNTSNIPNGMLWKSGVDVDCLAISFLIKYQPLIESNAIFVLNERNHINKNQTVPN